MKNLTKKDLIYLWIIILTFIGLIFILTNTTYIYGSSLDWYAEHVAITEYFRTLFYKTHDLLPDFAFNIGNGQNIYNLSYYGLLSPIILISYLLPFVSMRNYMIISIIICVIVSTILLYIFLKKKNYSSEVCFLSSLIFIMSSPISFHSHRHIMFINYMPFLILGLFGVDKIFDKNRSYLLTISVFLMIITSYYFSIGGIVCLLLYGLYRYLTKMNKLSLKSFFKTFFKVLSPIIVGILCSAILILPTFATLINNRAPSNTFISLKDLFIPNTNISNLLFNSYGLGLNIIIIPSLIHLFKKDKPYKIFAFILTILVIFNIFNYMLNGTMYIDSKVLIPFLPLYILVIAEFNKDFFNYKVNYKYLISILMLISLLIILRKSYFISYSIELISFLIIIFVYNKSNKKIFYIIPMAILVVISSYCVNEKDHLVLKYTTNQNEEKLGNIINNITNNDQDFYRIANEFNKTETVNKIYNNINYYNSTIYSSISNQLYNSFYYDIMNNNIPARNRALTVTTPNIFYLLLTNNKYYISYKKALIGYEKLNITDGLNVYVNNNTLPLAFASSNLMSYEDFNFLSDQVKQEALLNVIVADTKTANNFVSNIQELDLDFKEILNEKNITIEKDGSYTLDIKENLDIKYELPSKYYDKIIMIRFKMNRIDEKRDLSISINNVKNKLTNKKWKYYNGNTVFDYVLANTNQQYLNINFSEGIYNLSDFESYVLDYVYLEKINDNINPLIIDKENTKGDFIKGEIDVTNDGYFMASIPYDKGFKIKVDDKVTNYEKVDAAFIGFKISKGHHNISIEYKAPAKSASIVLSILGLFLFIIINILESKRIIK